MTQTSTPVRVYRVITFALCVFYFLYLFYTSNKDAFGWQFRYLTVWGLTASVISAWFMLRLSMGWSTARQEVWASMTAVLNATVVLMYWKIYFTDPALFYGDGGGPEHLHQEYYLHAIGPSLQIVDALFILGAFSKLRRTCLAVAAVPILYVAWIEGILHKVNVTPEGSVTNGLPYLFLNDMDMSARLGFYGTTIVTMLMLFAVGAALSWVLRRIGFSPEGQPV